MSDSPTSETASANAPVATRVIGLAIIVLSGLQMMVVLDGTVANLALAPLQADLGLSDSGRNWVLTSYALAFGGLMLLGGRLGDAFGRKKMFIAGVSLFTVASLLCGLALNEGMLIAARALQGVGAAVASPTAFALVATTFAAGPARNQAIAIFAAMTGVGSIAGLIIGGALTEVSWRLIFLINVPIGIALVGMAFRALRETNQTRLALDVPGAILATLGCTGVVFALTEGPEMGWGSIAVIGALAAGLVALAAFLFVERTADNPLLPFSLFADRNRVATFLAIFFVGGAMFSMTAFVALFVQDIMQYSPLRAGIAFIPFAFGLGAAASVASKLAVKVQPRWLVLTGVVIMIVGLLYGSTLDSDSTYLANLFVPVIGIGFGIGLAMVPLPLCAIAGVPETEIGPLTAISQVAQTLGGPLALSVIGAMATSKTLSLGGTSGKAADMNPAQLIALGEGYTFALVGCAVCAVFAGIAALCIRFTPSQVAQAQAAEKAAQGIA
ncbi:MULTISPECIES: MFS transporter [Rhodococcus]|uniref:MFS transporter n=1 Tax=Rhodococcus TaxID=1827 RepID=UPI0001A212F4|nr:MFS transporter [Rhodococcus sp. 008]ARE34013.1 MFS transporter [Rhodococcus sp. BH4]EEN87425.1 transporter, major facilitator family protein [Rhodococcus erythropolis SK121]KLN69125.1 MFS transporter [Rhodococcus erythropolis]KSU81397.1 MFS transporter [Rhodococcus qingshengii]MBP2522547.1 EmrB/QacA subfamily drug resistance transporter [Rhodococcus sp. PvP104]MBQ9055575.1 MFS transporter [Rhodococcus sp. (in: high G+C Gram-positive bacteria)]MCE4164801.1 MFS transporter [Rhodococcus sp.